MKDRAVAAFDRSSPRGESADERHGGADERESKADERDRAADERDRVADDRDETADLRDRVADLRDRTAGEREIKADERESKADEREAALDRQRVDGASAPAALRAELVTLRREAAEFAEWMAQQAETFADYLEKVAADQDSERRLKMAAFEREVAAIARRNSARLRGTDTGPLGLEHLPRLPIDE
ncbi:MAG TPA: hypothetical protein DCQ30_02275 [Acidimicrobiaceae bacterium]|nr:hypothetical protein [Acidimicrobiaceae bacterium]